MSGRRDPTRYQRDVDAILEDALKIPKRVMRRPWCWRKHLPIPFIQRIDEAGVVQFRTEDHAKVARCAKRRLCQFCGERIDDHLTFLGGATAVAQRMFRQAPFHRECALYALATCPYLSRTKDEQFVVTAREYTFGKAHFPLSEGGVTANVFVARGIVSVVPVSQVRA